MKKTLCFLILSLFAINCTACSSNVNNSNPTFENVTQITSPASKAVEETTLEPETTQSDVLSTLSEMLLKIPCLEEQTKIAACLSAIDAKIDSVAQQLEQARVWKQGLLQQMFV